jgi:hypothetical protein
MNATYQNKKTSSYKHGSGNAFFPSYSLANLVTISTDILNFRDSACYLLHTGFLFGLFFDTDDGGDMFLQNVG